MLLLEYYIIGGVEKVYGLNLNCAWICLGLATPFYLTLYAYLDMVLPNSTGVKQSACFCCRLPKRPQINPDKKKKQKDVEAESSSDDDDE